MKEIYYYIRDAKNRPMTTICLLEDGGEVSKGIALCSDKDIPCKKAGRKIARERAIYAMTNRKDTCPLRDNPYVNLQIENYMYFETTGPFKSSYMPLLTDYEDKLLNFERK